MSLLRLFISVSLLFAHLCASAQQHNNDYYQARGDAKLSELLATVEKYHLSQGIEGVRSRNYLYAWGDLNFILNYFPNHPNALIAMASLCEAWKSPKCNMDAYFEKAIRRSPENEGVYVTKGIYLQRKGRLPEAVEIYKKSLTINPSSVNAHYNLGLAYTAQKQYSLANEHAQQAYALGMTLPGLQNKLIAAGAWKPIERRPAADQPNETTTMPPQRSATPSDEASSKLPEPESRSDQGNR